ncbi:hypothetical protein GCM10025876_26510 [Demequina litorisediminis]|uniref:ABC transmembrane type-1 domain-containing protein n=1 Tax=Demequina litorisediminis TaxID=1849022 RepID=A0ABQ6IEX3_9MICO|nr:hypothetical protein GCM10025876_26510 [Demequina litorisediminis]
MVGWRRGSRADWVVPFATFFSTVPYFWMALVVIAIFSTTLGWLPASHAYDKGSVPALSWDFIGEVIAHGTLPALTIIVSSLGGWILGMRNMMVTVLDEDYVTVAQAKGLRQRRVLTQYASRNAVLPQLQSFALSLGFIVGGTLVMEMVFSYPGLGKAPARRDQREGLPPDAGTVPRHHPRGALGQHPRGRRLRDSRSPHPADGVLT